MGQEQHPEAAQVAVRWHDYVVSVQRVRAGVDRTASELLGRTLRSGEARGEASEAELPAGWSAPLLVWGDDGALRVHAQPGAALTVRRRRKVGAGFLGDHLQRVDSADPAGVAVSTDATVLVALGELLLEVDGLARLERGWRGALAGALGGSTPFVTASAVVHLAILAFVAYATPAFGGELADDFSDGDRAWMQHHLSAAAEQEVEGGPALNEPVAHSGGTGDRAMGPEGEMGDEAAPDSGLRAANPWRARDSRPRLPSRALEGELDATAVGFGMAGLLIGREGVEDDEPNASWGQPEAQGAALQSANGNMWGRDIGAAHGVGGLGLSGVGEGGGGRGLGIGLGRIGTIGRGAGSGRGAGLGRSHRSRPPRVSLCGGSHQSYASLAEVRDALVEQPRAEVVCTKWTTEQPDHCEAWLVSTPSGCSSVSGRLPPEAVRAVLRQNHGRFRLCYQRGLDQNPALQGRVVSRFVVARDGSVIEASATGGLPNEGVKSCIANVLATLAFPRPVGGVVTVSYPLMLTPAD